MMIKDLEISKELTAGELSAVRGGDASTAGQQFGSGQAVGAGLISIGSPAIQVNPQIMPQIALNLDIAAIIASANAAVGQA